MPRLGTCPSLTLSVLCPAVWSEQEKQYWSVQSIMGARLERKASLLNVVVFNPNQRCEYSDSPFARIYFFHTAGSGNGLEEVDTVCLGKLTPKKKTFFVIEKYIEDLRQDEKHVPDLLESIIQPPGLVKEELRAISFKIAQFRSKIRKIQVLAKSQKFQNVFVDGPVPFLKRPNLVVQYLAPLGAKYFETFAF